MTTKKKCPRCQTELDEEAVLCWNCGLFFEAGEDYDEAVYQDDELDGED